LNLIVLILIVLLVYSEYINYFIKIKVIPSEKCLYELLTPLALAIWIQDDGTWKDVSIRIATNSFKLNEIEILKNFYIKNLK